MYSIIPLTTNSVMKHYPCGPGSYTKYLSLIVAFYAMKGIWCKDKSQIFQAVQLQRMNNRYNIVKNIYNTMAKGNRGGCRP